MPVQCFFKGILQPEYRAATDVYALMFLTDVIDFVIIIFGFWAFGVRYECLNEYYHFAIVLFIW